ncbi:MAG: hypothetical protein IJZ14_03325 [Oscillospiraceae bacterium]|nr:hypothetical protein [Oscillospiraceae bacterium]
MDIVIEILLEIYMELMFLVVPEKNASKKHIWLARIMAITVVLGIFALVIWGAVLIVDHNNLWGILPIAIAVVVSLAQIIAGIILFKKHH